MQVEVTARFLTRFPALRDVGFYHTDFDLKASTVGMGMGTYLSEDSESRRVRVQSESFTSSSWAGTPERAPSKKGLS
jgi:hypothetical protein